MNQASLDNLESANHGTESTCRRLLRHAISVLAWGYLLFIVGFWMVARLAEDRWWIASALLFLPSWMLAAPLALLFPVMLLVRRTLLLSVPAAAVILAFPIMGLKLAPQRYFSDGDKPHALRLLTCNIHRNHLDGKALAEVIRTYRPDIVALQDWSDRHRAELFGDGQWHTQRHGELFLASRYPIVFSESLGIRDPRDTSARDSRGSAARYELRTPRGIVHVINLHLASPHRALNAMRNDNGAALRENLVRRRYESQALRALTAQMPENLILAGDFNTTENSAIYRELWGDMENAFSTAGWGFGYTYSNNRTILRIDHILSSGSHKARRCWVGPAVGSPHRPLIADFD